MRSGFVDEEGAGEEAMSVIEIKNCFVYRGDDVASHWEYL